MADHIREMSDANLSQTLAEYWADTHTAPQSLIDEALNRGMVKRVPHPEGFDDPWYDWTARGHAA